MDKDGVSRDGCHKILECNRIAAKKCRVRKLDEASALASRAQTLEDQDRYLDVETNMWRILEGEFSFQVGFSSRNLKVEAKVTVL
jgi:hypothetical protein